MAEKKKKTEKPPSTSAQAGDGSIVIGGNAEGSTFIVNPPAPPREIHDTIGFIPPAKAETYVHRGKIEDDVTAFIRKGGRGAIVGVHAPGGLGKTELAKNVAEELKGEYDLLWVDVGKKEAEQLVGEILLKCGVQMQPGDSYERLKNELQHAYQTRKFLVVFDDAREASLAGLADLLPPSPCAALVTSRIREIGGVRNFELGAMSWEQAKELFEAVLGEETVASEQETVRTLAKRCKFNPLAMEIAARRIRQFEGTQKPVARYFETAAARFSALKMEGDPRWDMNRIFDLSYDDLSGEDQVRFQALAAFHPTGFSIEAAAYLWDMESDAARDVLARFVNLSLVKPVDAEARLERYRLHDLLDEYAAGKLRQEGREAEAFGRLADWLVRLFDEYYTVNPDAAPHLAVERENLLQACAWALGGKNADLLALLVTNARNWFMVVFTESWAQWYAWLEASIQLGLKDAGLKANVLQAIGDVQGFRDERDAALESYNAALTLFRQVGSKLGEANVLQAIGDVQGFRDERDAALESYNAALTLFRQVGSKLGEANVRKAIDDVQGFRKENDAALESYNAALTLFRQVGSKLGEANVRKAIGDVQGFRKENDAALESYNAALTLFRQVGDKLGEANVRKAIGDVQGFRKENDAALESYNAALTLFRQVGDKLGEANVHLSLGGLKREEKDLAGARKDFEGALSAYRAIGDQYSEARALYRLGDCFTDEEKYKEAILEYEEAIRLWTAIGLADLAESILKPRLERARKYLE
ncbi:MAG: hypothetical protein JETCAE02_22610 [Anaerolineaceae bacterium]|nr:MAG: tetratricopeptide repeat protein [Anaerolineales bacterium]GJQ39849.1 MAG: hypothetical protein JETCAE02_22610 [Anaerolineaceae bacterium]